MLIHFLSFIWWQNREFCCYLYKTSERCPQAESEMVGKDNLKTEDLNLCFEKLMMLGGSGIGKGGVKMEGGVINEWKDIPMELLLQIVSLVDDQTVVVASGVCRGWRDAICLGLTRLSLSWYIFSFAYPHYLSLVYVVLFFFWVLHPYMDCELYGLIFLSLNHKKFE
jgi:hypothetical protein